MSYIDKSIVIDFDMPTVLKEAIALAEEADKENDFVSFVNYVDNIDIVAKNCYANGAISKKQWDLLIIKYVLYEGDS